MEQPVKIRKYQTDKRATCSDCEFEWWKEDCESRAKQHTRDTGHITTIHIQMDVAQFDDD